MCRRRHRRSACPCWFAEERVIATTSVERVDACSPLIRLALELPVSELAQSASD